MNKTIASPAFKFAGVGFLNVFVTLSIVFALKKELSMGDGPANFIGYVAGLLCSFSLNKRWTFGDSSGSLMAFLRFLVVFFVSYVLNIFTVLTAIRTGTHDYLAHIVGMPVYTLAFYLGCRWFAFPAPKASRTPLDFPPDRAPYRANITAPLTHSGGRRAWTWFAFTLAFSAIIVFYRLGEMPIVLWDESRVANNALEMSISGLSLIPTYNWTPDHWNTKPPVLIWAMASAIKLFGPSEIAVRLPSALSSLATSAILFSLCAWHLRRPVAGFVAVLLLYATPGYVLFHGARSGDYESMLTLWTSSYLIAGYLVFRTETAKKPVWIAVCSACIALSFMTKTIQGLIMLPPLIAFLLLQKRSNLFPHLRALTFSAVFVVAVCGGYYLLREQFDPGYFKAVQANDLAVRYATVIEQHGGDWTWYLSQTTQFPWLIPGFLLAGWQLRQGAVQSRPLVLLLFIVAVFYFAVISLARTKLVWYAAPLSPICALIVAIGVTDLFEKYRKAFPLTLSTGLPITILLSAAAATVILFNFSAISAQISTSAANYLDAYGLFMRGTHVDRIESRKLAIVHPGYQNLHKDPFYIAPLLFYVTSLKAEGRDVDIIQPGSGLPNGADAAFACGAVRTQFEKREPGWTARTDNGLCTVYSFRQVKP